MESLPTGYYGFLSARPSPALVSRAGSVDGLCFPLFDAPDVFARLLDSGGGHFSIRPAGDFQASRAYTEQTMALETTFVTTAGTAVLTDAMAVGRNERGHDLGAGSPGVLLRRLFCTAGELDIDVSYAPRPEYGLIHPILEAIPGGVAARGGTGRLLYRRGHRQRPPAPGGRAGGVLRAGARAGGGAAVGRLGCRSDYRAPGRHAGGVAVLVGDPPKLRGPVARAGPPLRAGTPG